MSATSPPHQQLDEEHLLSSTSQTNTPNESGEDTTTSKAKINTLLYTSHILSTWNSRQFEFGAFLFLATLYPRTLLPASVYALARSASAVLVSPWIGQLIDRHDRLRVVRWSIVGQRIPVAVSCIGFFLFVKFPWLGEGAFGLSISLLVLSLLACIEKLAAVANTIAIERDWVVVIAHDDEDRLGQLNSQMRRIDLFCKLVAPLAVSILDSYSTTWAIIATGIISTTSSIVEYIAIERVYAAESALQSAKVDAASTDITLPTLGQHSFLAKMKGATKGLVSYVASAAFLPSFSLSLLYLTVLSFNGQLITYLLALGLPAILITVMRGFSAMVELSATWLAPKVTSRIGPVRAGIWFLNWEIVFVGLAAASLWIFDDLKPTMDAENSMPLLIIGVVVSIILSRLGLWGFDLSAQITIQSSVPPSDRGSFSAWEQSFQNTFEMLSFSSTIVWSAPADFKYPATISAFAVGIAGALYAVFVRARRGHLVHLSKCMERKKRGTTGWIRIGENDEQDVELEDVGDRV